MACKRDLSLHSFFFFTLVHFAEMNIENGRAPFTLANATAQDTRLHLQGTFCSGPRLGNRNPSIAFMLFGPLFGEMLGLCNSTKQTLVRARHKNNYP